MTPSYASAAAASSGGRRAATFAGASVYLSRNLVVPEVFDAVHDALRLNGTEVFLCADPGRTGPVDFHVISSSSHIQDVQPPRSIFAPDVSVFGEDQDNTHSFGISRR